MSDAEAPPIYMGPDNPLSERVDDMVGRMTLAEKIAIMMAIWYLIEFMRSALPI